MLVSPSVMAPTVSAGQPRWRSEADRVVTIQRRVQAVSPALLHAVRHGRGSYILRELQPFEDRLSLGPAHADGPRLEDALRVMAELMAWGQLRGSGRQGSATGDELIAFGRDRSWGRPLMEFAGHCASTTRAYWKEFATAYDSGGLAADGVPPSLRSRR